MEIKGFKLDMTCGACPEQYDVFKDGELVGYLRLRHGYFRAEWPNCDGETVYEASTIGDGIFHESEKEYHLKMAINAIEMKMNEMSCV